jgi:hypothetical protein
LSQRDHQLAAETLLSIGPTTASRPPLRDQLSPLPAGSDRPSENRGTKRKTPEGDGPQSSAHGRGDDRPGYYGLTSRGWGAGGGRPSAADEARDHAEGDRSAEREHYHEADHPADRERDADKDKLVDRRPPGPGSQIAQNSSRQLAHPAANGAAPSRAGYINTGYGYPGQRTGNFKYGALFGAFDGMDPSRGSAAAPTPPKAGAGSSAAASTTSITSARPHPTTSWANPYPPTIQNSTTSMPGGSGPTSLLRKELLEHRDHLMDSKRWLETNLARTERLLNQVNDRLAESVAASSSVNNGMSRGSSLSTLIGRDRMTAEEEAAAAAKARLARDRGELPQQAWSSSPRGGNGLGSSGLFGLGGYGSSGVGRGGGGGSDWDAVSRERQRAREYEKNCERERERERDRERNKERHERDKGSAEREKESTTTSAMDVDRPKTGNDAPEVVALPRKRDASGTNSTYRSESFWPLAP